MMLWNTNVKCTVCQKTFLQTTILWIKCCLQHHGLFLSWFCDKSSMLLYKKREFNVYLFKLIYCNPCDSVNVHDVDAQREFVTWHCKSCRNVTSLWLSSAAAQPFVFSERSRMPTIKVPNTLHFEVFLNPCMLVCFDHTTLVYKNTFSSSKLLPPSRPILGSLSHNPHQ